MVTDIDAGIWPVMSPRSGSNSLQLSSSDQDKDPVPFLTPAIRQLILHSSESCVWLCLYCIKSKYNFLIHRIFSIFCARFCKYIKLFNNFLPTDNSKQPKTCQFLSKASSNYFFLFFRLRCMISPHA